MRSQLYKTFFVFINCLFFTSLGLSQGDVTADAQDKRSYRIDDWFSQEGLSGVSFSSDGRALVYVRSRPPNSLPPEALDPLKQRPIGDVWIQEAPGLPARNITQGAQDVSGWWNPVWSPDGKRIAVMSSRGGNFTVWVWERATDRLRQASTQGVSYAASGLYWVDDRHVLVLAPRYGDKSFPENISGGRVRAAEAAWAASRRGEVTASAIRSTEFQYPNRSLFLLDVVSGQGRRIAETLERHFFYPDFWPSPDGRHVALVSPKPAPYNLMSSASMGFPHDVELRTINGDPVKLDYPLPENIHTQTLKWSPNGKELAFFANGKGPINPILLYGMTAAEVMPQEEWKVPVENPARLYRLNLEKTSIDQVPTGDIDLGYLGAPDFMWTSTGELVFHAPKKQYGRTAGPEPSRGAPWGWRSINAPPLVPQPPREWLLLDRRGRTRPLSHELPKEHGRFWSINGGGQLLAVAGGDVISVNPATGGVRNLTERFSPKVFGIHGADTDSNKLISSNRFPPSSSKVVVSAEGGRYVLDLIKGEARPLQSPDGNANLLSFDERFGSVVYQASGVEGLYLWRAEAVGKPELLVETNKYWREVRRNEAKVIEYTGLDGEKRTAELLLPIGYKAGRRYPVSVEVYPEYPTDGTYPNPGRPGPRLPSYSKDSYAEVGYVYLKPTVPANLPGMPTPGRAATRHGEEGVSCQYMLNSVVPAVDKLIEMGIADPERLFVWGHSWGGWATLCVVGQTIRFKAAIAQSAAPGHDWALAQGSTRRYYDHPSHGAGITQTYYNYSNVPWWRDGDRLRRNDPITYAERIRTPLMLIHGDIDPVPIEYSEKFFNALVTMRKPAEFVRYWGEGHENNNPANLRDEYMRKIAWFDRWGDIARDEKGNMIWDGDRVKGRKGAPALDPEDYAKFDLFQPSPARRQNQAAAANKGGN